MFRSASKSPKKRRRSLEERTAKWWRRCGSKERGFWYQTADGERIKAKDALERIQSLVIPPAWSNVRIAPRATAPLQAIGHDSRGRAQYLYHPAFVERQQARKFGRIPLFGKVLPALRRTARHDLAAKRLTKERVLAVIVRLIDELYFRVGSERSVKAYRTFGITTLRSSHLTISPVRKNGRPALLDFNFVGKHHVRHRRIVVDPSLAAILAELKALPGSRLFKYAGDDGLLHNVSPTDVNAYMKQITRREFTAKDFRTWGGTLLAAIELAKEGLARTKTECKRKIVAAVKRVAERLGNTPSVCRSSYIHPRVLSLYERGKTLDAFRAHAARSRAIGRDEAALLSLLTAPLPQRR